LCLVVAITLCTKVTRVIVNHSSIGEYQLIFFLREELTCLYGEYSIEMRRHICYECKRFNNYWNLRRDIISYFTLFLEFNSDAFSFG